MRFKAFLPKAYYKNIYDINYDLLKQKGINCLVFDLDNTIALIDQKLVTKDTIKLFSKLEKYFTIVIISNNIKKRVKNYATKLNCDYISSARKPLLKGFKIIKKRYNLKNNQICMIGDQIVTDIFGGNRFSAFTILVDPMAKKDLKITALNRLIEAKILKYFEQNNIMKKGVYYNER